MEIWRRRCDVPQTWHAQNFRLRRRQRMEYAMPLEEIAADIYALVAGTTSQRLEEPISIQFVCRQRGRIAREPMIEPAAGRHESSLKAGDGVRNICSVGPAAVGSGELPTHAGIRFKLIHNFGSAGAHNPRAFQ